VLYDSSFLIDYLDGDTAVLTYADEHAAERPRTVHLVLYEVYLGELNTREKNLARVEKALQWVEPISTQRANFGRRAAELMRRLEGSGARLSFRDGYIAAAAWSHDERLVTRDRDFDTQPLREKITVEIV
jgi:predicted nucleic acid-binding protein